MRDRVPTTPERPGVAACPTGCAVGGAVVVGATGASSAVVSPDGTGAESVATSETTVATGVSVTSSGTGGAVVSRVGVAASAGSPGSAVVFDVRATSSVLSSGMAVPSADLGGTRFTERTSMGATQATAGATAPAGSLPESASLPPASGGATWVSSTAAGFAEHGDVGSAASPASAVNSVWSVVAQVTGRGRGRPAGRWFDGRLVDGRASVVSTRSSLSAWSSSCRSDDMSPRSTSESNVAADAFAGDERPRDATVATRGVMASDELSIPCTVVTPTRARHGPLLLWQRRWSN